MNFFPGTAIEIPRRSGGPIAAYKEPLWKFWNRVEVELEAGLSGPMGPYIFAVRAGKAGLAISTAAAHRTFKQPTQITKGK